MFSHPAECCVLPRDLQVDRHRAKARSQEPWAFILHVPPGTSPSRSAVHG